VSDFVRDENILTTTREQPTIERGTFGCLAASVMLLLLARNFFGCRDEMKSILDAQFTLHDSYATFSMVMDVTQSWFVPQHNEGEVKQTRPSVVRDHESRQIGMTTRVA